MITRESCHDLQYFIGKLCTIMAPPMGLHLDNRTYPEWFTVTVDQITSDAVWGTDPQRGTKAVYFFPILGIVEEQVLDSNHPDYEKIKSEISQRKVPVGGGLAPVIDPIAMAVTPSSAINFATDQLEQSAAKIKERIKGDKQ